MTAWGRLAGGLLVLSVYTWVLKPQAAVVQPRIGVSDDAVEADAAVSEGAFKAGRYGEALEPTSRLVDRFPAQHVYLERLARIFEQLNRFADAAAVWERVVELSPTPVDACLALGNAYAHAGDTRQALQAFERCVPLDPRNAEALFFLGRAYERANRTAEASVRYSASLAIDPSGADSQLGLARLALRENRAADARRRAAAVLERFPSNVDALLVAGLAAEQEGRAQQARTLLEQANGISETGDAHIALGRLDFTTGRRADARRHFERALELSPESRGDIAVWLERTARSR